MEFTICNNYNVPVVFMAVRNGFEGCNIITRGIGRVGLKIETFLGPEMARAPSNVAPLKTIKYKLHKNNWYIGSFMYPSAVV